ncbi:esterase-like activity of phytase family protein [Paenibacillus sp. 481]|uniref:esterase-like activity of phytase family protein n=1 Tax=Paenibacillus sp. 481 TaxID=2835869 RepID=UPI001E3E2615|nr:esterase-like activity of phytase family protein [Paenibacillus sp. 481]UHA75485.1 esterase-like activity of phytase family protein [Paenibacillus sp. 481]
MTLNKTARKRFIFALMAVMTFSSLPTAYASIADCGHGFAVTAEYEWKKAATLGKGIREGGLSGLVRIPSDPANVFYTVADRGPHGEVGAHKRGTTTSSSDATSSRLYKIRVSHGEIEVLETIKIRQPGVRTEGLHLEGIAYNPNDDTFWLGEHYRPSLVQIKRNGTIVGRYVPEGTKEQLRQAGVREQGNTVEMIPASYRNLAQQRGFENVTISPDGKYLFATTQSSLAAGQASRHFRVLKLDLKKKKAVAEYVYQTDRAADYKHVQQQDIVLSELSALSTSKLLVNENDTYEGTKSKLKRIYRADFEHATNILGSKVSDNLEKLSPADLKAKGIVVASKKGVVDLVTLGYANIKPEGLTVIDEFTLALVNDNDYGVNYDRSSNLVQTGVPTKLQIISLLEGMK